MPVQNAFTVDLEEWFQGLTSTNRQVERWAELESRVEGATQRLLDLLAALDTKATFFTLGHVADHHPALIERIAAAGHEIAVHGYYHRFVHRLTPDEFARELELTLTALHRITGEQPIGHRAPYFSIRATTLWAFDLLRDFGFQYDSSVFPTRNPLYGYPGAPRLPYRLPQGLWEFPPSTMQVSRLTLPVAGGFYFRALPYALVCRAIRQLNTAGQPAIFYVHPWELDTDQHYPHVTPRERLTHYHGRAGLHRKLHRLLNDFSFAPLRSMLSPDPDAEHSTPRQPPVMTR